MLKLRVMTLILGGGGEELSGAPEKTSGKSQGLATLIRGYQLGL